MKALKQRWTFNRLFRRLRTLWDDYYMQHPLASASTVDDTLSVTSDTNTVETLSDGSSATSSMQISLEKLHLFLVAFFEAFESSVLEFVADEMDPSTSSPTAAATTSTATPSTSESSSSLSLNMHSSASSMGLSSLLKNVLGQGSDVSSSSSNIATSTTSTANDGGHPIDVDASNFFMVQLVNIDKLFGDCSDILFELMSVLKRLVPRPTHESRASEAVGGASFPASVSNSTSAPVSTSTPVGSSWHRHSIGSGGFNNLSRRQSLSSDDNADAHSEDRNSLVMEVIITMSLQCMEVILRDSKYQAIVSMKSDFIRDILNLLHGLATTEQRRRAIYIIYNIGRVNASKIHIGKNEGFKKMLYLLEKDNDEHLAKEILRTVRHFVYPNNQRMSGAFVWKDDIMESELFRTAKSQPQYHLHASQQQQGQGQPFFKSLISKLFSKKPDSDMESETTKETNRKRNADDQGRFVNFPPQRREVIAAMERITVILEQQEMELTKDADTMAYPKSGSKDSEDTLRELIVRQNVIPTLTQALKNNSFELQLDIATTISRLVFHSHRNQEEMRRIDGYSVFIKMLNFSPEFTTAESRSFLRMCFDMIFVIILDGNESHEIGNFEALKILVQLVLSNRYEVQQNAIRSLLDLLAVNTVNAVYINYISGEDTLFDALVHCGQEQEEQQRKHQYQNSVCQEPGHHPTSIDPAQQASEQLTMSQRQKTMRLLIQLLTYQYTILSHYHQGILISFASCLNSPECTHDVKMLCLETVCKILGDIKTRQQDVDKTFLTKFIKYAMAEFEAVVEGLNRINRSYPSSKRSSMDWPTTEVAEQNIAFDEENLDTENDQYGEDCIFDAQSDSSTSPGTCPESPSTAFEFPVEKIHFVMESLMLLDKGPENVLLFQQMGLLDIVQALVQENVPVSIVSHCLTLFKNIGSAFPYHYEPTLLIGLMHRNKESPQLLCSILASIRSMFNKMRNSYQEQARICKGQFREYGGIDIILKLLQSKENEVVYCSIYLLAELYCDCKENKSYIAQKLGSQGFLNLLTSNHNSFVDITSDMIDMAFELATTDSFIMCNSRKQYYLPEDILRDFLTAWMPDKRVAGSGLLFQHPLSASGQSTSSLPKTPNHKRTMSLNKRNTSTHHVEFTPGYGGNGTMRVGSTTSIRESGSTDSPSGTPPLINKHHRHVALRSGHSKKTRSFDDSDVLERLSNSDKSEKRRHLPPIITAARDVGSKISPSHPSLSSQSHESTSLSSSPSSNHSFSHRRVRSVPFQLPLSHLSNIVFWNSNFASMIVDLFEATNNQVHRENIIETALHLLRANPLNIKMFCQAVQSTVNNPLLRLVKRMLQPVTTPSSSNSAHNSKNQINPTLCVDLISTVYSYAMQNNDLQEVLRAIDQILSSKKGMNSRSAMQLHVLMDAIVATTEDIHPQSFLHFNGIDSTMNVGLIDKIPSGGYTLAFWMNCCSIAHNDATILSLHDRTSGSILRVFLKKTNSGKDTTSQPSTPVSASFSMPHFSNNHHGHLCTNQSYETYALHLSMLSPHDWLSMRNSATAEATTETHECKNFHFTTGRWYHIVLQNHPKDGFTIHVNGYRVYSFMWSSLPKNNQPQSKGVGIVLGSLFHPSVVWPISSASSSSHERATSPRLAADPVSSSVSSISSPMSTTSAVTQRNRVDSKPGAGARLDPLHLGEYDQQEKACAFQSNLFHGSLSTLYLLRGRCDDALISKWYHTDGAVLSHELFKKQHVLEGRVLFVMHPHFESIAHVFRKPSHVLHVTSIETSAPSVMRNSIDTEHAVSHSITNRHSGLSASNHSFTFGGNGGVGSGSISTSSGSNGPKRGHHSPTIDPMANPSVQDLAPLAHTGQFSVGISGKLVRHKRKQGTPTSVEAIGGITSHITSALNAFTDKDCHTLSFMGENASTCNRSVFITLEIIRIISRLEFEQKIGYMLDVALRILINAVTVCNANITQFQQCGGCDLLLQTLAQRSQHVTSEVFKQLMVLSCMGHRSGKDLLFADRKTLFLLLDTVKLCSPSVQNQCLKLLSHALLSVSENMKFWKTEGPGLSGMLDLCHFIVQYGLSGGNGGADENTASGESDVASSGSNTKNNNEALAMILNVVEQMFSKGNNSSEVSTLIEFTFSLMEHGNPGSHSHNTLWHFKTKDLLLGMVYNMMKLSTPFRDEFCNPVQNFYLFFSLLGSPFEDIRVKGLKIISLFLHNNSKLRNHFVQKSPGFDVVKHYLAEYTNSSKVLKALLCVALDIYAINTKTNKSSEGLSSASYDSGDEISTTRSDHSDGADSHPPSPVARHGRPSSPRRKKRSTSPRTMSPSRMAMFNNAPVTYIGAIKVMLDLLSICTDADIVLTTLEYFEMTMLSEMHLKQCLDQGNWLELFSTLVEELQRHGNNTSETRNDETLPFTQSVMIQEKLASILQQFIYEDMARPHKLCKMTSKLREMGDYPLFQRYMVSQCVQTFENNVRLPVTVATNVLKNLSHFYDHLEDNINVSADQSFQLIDLVDKLAYENTIDVRHKMRSMGMLEQRDHIITRLLRLDLDSRHQLRIIRCVPFIMNAHPFFIDGGMIILLRMLHMAPRNKKDNNLSESALVDTRSMRHSGRGENSVVYLLHELVKLIHRLVRASEEIRKIVLKHTGEEVLARLMDFNEFVDPNTASDAANVDSAEYATHSRHCRSNLSRTSSQDSQDEGLDDDDMMESMLSEHFFAWYTHDDQKPRFQYIYQKVEHAWIMLYDQWNEKEQRRCAKIEKKQRSRYDEKKNEKSQLANAVQEYTQRIHSRTTSAPKHGYTGNTFPRTNVPPQKAGLGVSKRQLP